MTLDVEHDVKQKINLNQYQFTASIGISFDKYQLPVKFTCQIHENDHEIINKLSMYYCVIVMSFIMIFCGSPNFIQQNLTFTTLLRLKYQLKVDASLM